ncbi:DUF3060 domain-containing protein [Sphingomonas psychrotolerans]|nr:DUF3060 domain-containing protein [Sphingomonas psychrotolerans]
MIFSAAAFVGCVAPAVTLSATRSQDAVGAIEIDAQHIEVSGNGHKRTIKCDGRRVDILGSDHVITLTGTCAALDVSGNNNVVTVSIAPKGVLVVAGSDHKIRWRSTGAPRMDLSGVGNDVRRVGAN